MTKTCCVGGKHYIIIINRSVYEKLNPKPQKLVKVIKRTCSIVVDTNHKTLLSKWHEDKILLKKANAKIIIVLLCLMLHGVI